VLYDKLLDKSELQGDMQSCLKFFGSCSIIIFIENELVFVTVLPAPVSGGSLPYDRTDILTRRRRYSEFSQ